MVIVATFQTPARGTIGVRILQIDGSKWDQDRVWHGDVM
jgi:hypothetical protein